jgi:hypothetical protein
MTIFAKFASTCPKCQHPINVGDKIDWARGQKAAHIVCPAAPIHAVNVAPSLPSAVIGGIVNIVALLSKVSAANGGPLKAPKMRFLAPDGKSELRLQLAVRPKSPANVGAVYVRVNHSYVGSIRANGDTMIQDAALVATLTNIGNDPVAAAKAYGAFAGRCSFCNLELTDAGSVEVGYGPICAKHYNLPHSPKGTPTVKTVGTVAPTTEPFITKSIADVLSQFPKGTPARLAVENAKHDELDELEVLPPTVVTPILPKTPVPAEGYRTAPKTVEVVNGIRIVQVDE